MEEVLISAVYVLRYLDFRNFGNYYNRKIQTCIFFLYNIYRFNGADDAAIQFDHVEKDVL